MKTKRAARGLVAWLTASLLALSCGSTREDPTGGETHFLTRCDATDPNACGSALSCLCGVCTAACSERSECSSFPVAECVQSGASACGAADVAAHCDVSCAGDADCRVLSTSHRCAAGVCRAGASSDPCLHGEIPANQVLLIGDSFFASSHQVTAYLEGLAREAGVLAPGDRYRDNSRLIDNGLALGGSGILDQYLDASAEAPVDVVIMNGGGADVLLGSCDVPDASCPIITAAAAALDELFTQLAADGVIHVFYVFYPDPVDGNVRARMDALRPLAKSACDASAVDCTWLDLRPSFAGKYDDYIQPDGLNPTAEGSRASANTIFGAMQDRCIAQ